MASDDLPFPELVADTTSAEVRLVLGISLEYVLTDLLLNLQTHSDNYSA